MIKTVPFLTRARTVDHLGREQIADCPTAISELWKNAYDAYARNVELHVFDGEQAVAAIYDNGHGMTYQDFTERWLVVGTDTKYQDVQDDSTESGSEARHLILTKQGEEPLRFRPKQGQKGIGRLSSANLAPLLLLISKTPSTPFVAALIDWRIFENPYLILSDIEIPVTTFQRQEQLFEQLPELFDRLLENVWGGRDLTERKGRIEHAWKLYDELSDLQISDPGKARPSERIASTIIGTLFDERHLQQWEVWSGERPHGTALLMSEINFDLIAQLPDTPSDPTVEAARDNFVGTLSAFVDPLFDARIPEVNAVDPQFSYAVVTWSGAVSSTRIGTNREFTRQDVNVMEHVLEGTVDEYGVFRGQIKAFGKWQKTNGSYVIEPPHELKIPTGPTTRVGPVDIYIATYEQQRNSSTHTDEEWALFEDWKDRYSGLRAYRNSLRVLPYGRVDNDFFEIEMRRSNHAGREYWNARRMFGRLALSRAHNPNLKDKAGREGFIDNTAAKTLRLLVTNVLRRSARDYFGTASTIRKPTIEEIQKERLAAKAKVEREKLRVKQRRAFRTKLREVNKSLPNYLNELKRHLGELSITTKNEVIAAQAQLETSRSHLVQYRLPEAPTELGTLDEEYRSFRSMVRECQQLLANFAEAISLAIEQIKPAPEELIQKQFERNSGQLNLRLQNWRNRISELRDIEGDRFSILLAERNRAFQEQAGPIVEHVRRGALSLIIASNEMERCRAQIENESEEIFETYIRALESLKESIDLEVIAAHGVRENDELRLELDRLNALAQLGIAVEIVSHELQSYDDAIASGIRKLPKELQASRAVADIKLGYEGLTKQLNFLSPLKVSGQRTQRYITGAEISEYMNQFFEDQLRRESIKLVFTSEFLSFKVFEQPSRIFPVFINLLNNAVYWVGTNRSDDKIIQIGVRDERVIISDNGPGVDEQDVPSLFSLFFTRKLRGGRGVGLYLSRVNLTAGGHRIEYGNQQDKMPLPGANFVIDFKGAEYGDS
jgi:C4-dicarboxylate-specific signal transduction histidine kinase